MKKLLLIHHSGLLGGSGVSLKYILNSISSHYDVTIYVPDDPSELSVVLLKDSVARDHKHLTIRKFSGRMAKLTVYSGGNSICSVRFWYHALKIIPHYFVWLKILRLEQPDLIFVNSRVLCWFGLYSKKYKKICFVRETVDYNSNLFERTIIRRLLNRFDGRLFLSNYDYIVGGTKKYNSRVSYDFMDYMTSLDSTDRHRIRSEVRQSWGVGDSDFVLLFVGGVGPMKGLLVLLKALDNIYQHKNNETKNIKMVVAGSTSIESLKLYRNQYTTDDFQLVENVLYNDQSVTRRVINAGVVDDMSRLYRSADALVVPMIMPHQSRPAFEAGIFKLPVIISDYKCIEEFYSDNVNALLFVPGSSVDLAKKILELIDNDVVRERMVVKNYLEATSKRCVSNSIEAILNLCNDILR